MDTLNILYSYYGQKDQLKKQVLEWQKYKDKVSLTYVDDCFPEPLEKIEGVNVYRILDDIKWNQPGARNLGMKFLKGWCILLDMDFILTEENLIDIWKVKLRRGNIYFLGRKNEMPGDNVYIIHKEDFDKVGGYDEDFCGHYGFDDANFNQRAKILNRVELYDIELDYERNAHANLERDIARNMDMLKWKLTFPEVGKQIRFKYKKL